MAFRQNTYNEGPFNTLVPIIRKHVVAGESLDMNALVRWQSDGFNDVLISGGIVSAYLFYVPHRLVWSGWMDFASERIGSVPLSQVPWDFMFEKHADTHAVLSFFRRGYKLIQNQYFGSKEYPASYYDDPFDDTVAGARTVRTLDQYFSKIIPSADVEERQYEAPVTGTAPDQVATITLNEFRQAMANARAVRRQDMTGHKYVDALGRMGVNLDWKIQMAPEFLGMVKADYGAREINGTGPQTDIGRAGAAIGGTLNLKSGRRYFAEHGYVIGVMVVRPIAFNNDLKRLPDAALRQHADFFFADEDAGITEVPVSEFGSGSGNVKLPRFEAHLSTPNMRGIATGNGFTMTYDGGGPATLAHPEITDPPSKVGQIDQTFAVFTRVAANMTTPVKRVTL